MIDKDGISVEEHLEDEILAEGIELISAPTSLGALSVEIGAQKAIICSPDLPQEERVVAKAHELAHFQTESLYPINTRNRGKSERIAFSWCVARLLPYELLCSTALRLHSLSPVDISEALDLPAEFVSDAEVFHFETKGRRLPYAEI